MTILGCDVHEQFANYPLLLSSMDFIACRTGQGISEPDHAYSRHRKIILGTRPFLAWHVQKPWQSALAQVDAFLKIQPPAIGVRHAWDCELEWQSKNAVTDHLAEIMRLMLVKTGDYPMIYSGKWFIDPWIDVSALPSETQWWLAEYAESKKDWHVHRDSGGYTIIDEQLHFPLTPIEGVEPEQVLIHQATSRANGRYYGAWNGEGRLDIDFWLDSDKYNMLQWFKIQQGDDMRIKVKPEALPWTVQVDSPGERVTSTEPLEVKATEGDWHQLMTGKWVPAWHYDVVEAPAPELPKVLFNAIANPPVGDYLNIRVAANNKATIVGQIHFGTLLNVYEVNSNVKLKPWYRTGINQWVAGWYCIPPLPPETTPPPKQPNVLDIAPLWQRDPRWINVKLGTSNTTIGNVGCLLTDITSYVNYLLGTNYTPPEMNEIIKKVGGWVHYDEATKSYLPGGNLFRFASLWEAFPQIGADRLLRTPLVPADLTVIDAIMADKRPVIVETRINKSIQHWVLIVGKGEGKYWINDPWTGKRAFFEDVYGDAARWIYSTVSYRKAA